MANVIKRYFKYLLTSSVGGAVEMVALWLLSFFIFKGGFWLEYIISPIIAFQISVPVNYYISYFYVWGDRKDDSTSEDRKCRWKKRISYTLLTTLVFLVRLGTLLIIEKFYNWDVLTCSIIAMIVSGILNFIISNQLIFKDNISTALLSDIFCDDEEDKSSKNDTDK